MNANGAPPGSAARHRDTAATPAKRSQPASISVTQRTATVPQAATAKIRRPPLTAYVSLYAPSGRRRWWWYSYRCARCSAYQLGRAETAA